MRESRPRLVRSAELTASVDYAYAARANGPLVLTAGACPLDEHGATVCVDDPAGQARQCVRNLAVTLREAETDLDHVVRCTVYVATRDRERLRTAWSAVRDEFGSHDPPATLLGVSLLGYDDQLVEVDAMATLP
ncbi:MULTISPECIES: RidA family protein [unclassified Actinopolyspora]|uniref:RidA family protein n=1 Tax=unclassified Actinopolyspora TaxID=2639451 RepID=UPI0013F617B8|nr:MULTISPECIES: RidA family protein [unclassified Actinopolyspora]NHD15619.1 RidA family protein [Actinopolyspora sp. BKK2]NHE75168.1 RidA family protein [Actinopolyspora sp. BKK1]